MTSSNAWRDDVGKMANAVNISEHLSKILLTLLEKGEKKQQQLHKDE